MFLPNCTSKNRLISSLEAYSVRRDGLTYSIIDMLNGTYATLFISHINARLFTHFDNLIIELSRLVNHTHIKLNRTVKG